MKLAELHVHLEGTVRHETALELRSPPVPAAAGLGAGWKPATAGSGVFER